MADATNLYDAVIVGGGPAGLTAALYLARARYRVLVVERDRFGGQITITSEVVNYPGVFRASGGELADTMRRQAEAFGAEFMLAEVVGLDAEGDVKTVRTSRGDVACLGVLLATGANPRPVGFKGEEEFRGHGVAYCATCDGEFFEGKDVFVVGGGFAAAEESVFLTRYARSVTVLIRRDGFSCAPAAAEEALRHPKITVLPHTEVEEVAGDGALRYLRYRNNRTGKTTEYRPPQGDTFGVFVLAGYAPATELVRGMAELTDDGYVATDERCQTSVPGLFAAGDVCAKGLRQVVTAAGEAALAATSMERHLAAAHERTGLVPTPPVRRAPTGDAHRAGSAGDPVPSGAPAPAAPEAGEGALFTPDMLAQLATVFDRMESSLVLRLALDGRPVSSELRGYMEELAKLTPKLTVELDGEGPVSSLASAGADAASDAGEGDGGALRPFVSVCRADGTPTGISFHGVPGGHEFTSFVLGLYNAAGPGQPLDEGTRAAIAAIDRPVRLQVFVSLSCTMCPDLVTAAERIASLNPQVTVDIYDIAHFPALKERHNVMSVPCLVVDGGARVSFGKKTLPQLIELIG